MPEQEVIETPVVTPETTITPETPAETKPAAVEEKTLLGSEDTDETEDSKEAEEKSKTTETPEYDLKVPEGMTVDQALLEKVLPVFKEAGITQETAQKLVDVYAPYLQSTLEAQRQESIASFKETVEGWKTETKKYLGANAAQELKYAAKFINKMTDNPAEAKALREFFEETGVGNYILLNKLMIKAGKKISDDSFVDPDSSESRAPLGDMSNLYKR